MAGKAQPKQQRKRKAVEHHDSPPSVFTCPDCQGTLFLVRNHGLVQFRCRVGHAYSPESMLEAQDENVERLLWSAIRALEEQAEFTSQLASQFGKSNAANARRFLALSKSAHQKAMAMRDLITGEAGHSRKPAANRMRA